MRRVSQLALVVAVACTCTVATAETGIDTVVKVIEARYSLRHHGVPGLWLAKPFMIGSGAGGLKISVFENFSVPPQDVYAMKEQVRRALGPEWSAFVETWSNRDGEWSVIYARTSGHALKMLIVTSEQDEVTVLQMHVSGRARDGWLDEPVKKAAHRAASHAVMQTAETRAP